ncbi:MAG: pseudouridine synthase [Gammaproteobacteria bacterium]|nr:pseudouridine synthase [Gammaproteobacteria bacterium]
MDTQKLQKVLAGRGLGSRREVEGWIATGRVTVNGETAHLGQRVGEGDVIALDGRRLGARSHEPSRVLVLNKAFGVICTRRDPQGRRSVFEGLPKLRAGRWIAIGRLDIQTTGLLLLTTDGALAHRMMHPSTGLDREYAVRVDALLDESELQVLTAGLIVDGERQRFSDVKYYDGSGRNHWYHVVLMEGRNREVRKLFEGVGARVSRLKRVRYGPVMLPSRLKRGAFAEMEQSDLENLYKLLKLTFQPQRGKVSRKRRASFLLPYPPLRHLRPVGPARPR